MAPIAHEHQPDASMPSCRSLSGFLGKRCLADQTQDPPSSKASQKQHRKRSTRDRAHGADPSALTSKLSIIELLSQSHSKRDPALQSLSYGAQMLTGKTEEERVQIEGDNQGEASVLHAVSSEEIHSLDAHVRPDLPEQTIMVPHLQLLGDEIAESSRDQSAQANAQESPATYKLEDVSEPLLNGVYNGDEQMNDDVVDGACPLKLKEAQEQGLILGLCSSGSSVSKQDLRADPSNSDRVMEVVQIQTFIELIQQAQPSDHQVTPALESRQDQERSEMLYGPLVTCEQPCVVNTNSEEPVSHDSPCIGKFDSGSILVNVFNSSEVIDRVQSCMEGKLSFTCQQEKQGVKVEGDVRRSSRIKKLFDTGCHNQELTPSKLVASSSLDDNKLKSTQSDFFLPASKKSRKQNISEESSIPLMDKLGFKEKRPREEKGGPAQKGSAVISSKHASSNDEFFKPASKRQKRILNATADEQLNSMAKDEKGEKVSVFEFDLWRDAKLAAEENAQRCVGKATHPFFSQHKGGHRALNIVGLSANECFSQPASSFEEMELIPSPPFHVTQLPEAKVHSTNLESWASNQKVESITLKKESIGQIRENLGSLLRVSLVNKLTRKPMNRMEYSRGQPPLYNDLEPLFTFLKGFEDGSEENLNQEKIDFSLAYLEDRFKLCLSDRAKRCSEVSSDMTFACTDEGRAHKSLLWSDVYQPQSPKQVCGNRDSVNVLNSWLEKWQAGSSFVADLAERSGSRRKKMPSNENSDEGHDCFQEDSDSEGSAKEDGSSQNVLFLAGPVGCGKTAAIYACARAHGFTVIEVNSSDNRNGLVIKQKFSESMESHRLGKWDRSADTTEPPSCTSRDTLAAADTIMTENIQHVSNKKRTNQRKKQKPMNDLTSASKLLSNKAVLQGHTEAAPISQDDGSKECDKSLTVLLFEDVDMVFEDDRGFIAAVAQLAATAKRPIILTSNDKDLCLPHRLGADLLEFKKPSTKELVVMAYLICVAEGIPCKPEILLQIVKLCCHDLRLLLNYLQFWSQGRSRECLSELEDLQPSVEVDKEGKLDSALESQEADSATSTLLFELEAHHRIWPSCLPLEFPCPVTQSIASEVNNKVSQVQREFDLEEEMKLQHSILEKLALMKKLKRQKIDSPSRAERKDASNDLDGLTAEEIERLETPVKNLKGAKTVARSPILREKLKKDLSTIMSDSAGIKEDLDGNHQPVLETTVRHESGKDDLSDSPLEGTSGTCSTMVTSSIGAGEIATPPGLQLSEHDPDRELLSNNTDVGTESMRHNVLMKGSRQKLVSNIQTSEKLRCDCDESILQQISDPINTMWCEFRNMKQRQGLVYSSMCKESLATASFISELSENLSICDVIMSRLDNTEEMALENILCLSTFCERLESSNILQACSMVALKSLLSCIGQCRALPSIQEKAITTFSFEDMMLAVNDPCALGKLVAFDDSLPSSRGFKLQTITPLSQEHELKRREKKSSLHRALYDELPLKAQLSLQRASFFEDVSFLARIELLEQERLNAAGTRRRGVGYQKYFRTHPWNLSKASINIIEQFGKFGRSCSADL